MAFVRIEQRNARLAAPVKVEYVKGRDGEIAKGTVTVISNARRVHGDERSEESTAIQWTLWARQAENAAQYLDKGSHVNIVGRLRNNHYTDAQGQEVYGFAFTCEEIDYLDSKAETEARRSERREWTDAYDAQASKETAAAKTPAARSARPASRN